MTIVVAFSLLTEVVVIADTRISWEGNQQPPQDILMKLCTFGDAKRPLVLGFSGNLKAAKIVLDIIRPKLYNYKQPFISARFKDRLAKWFEEAATLPEVRGKVKFMLCGIESSRPSKLLSDGKVVGYLDSFIEPHIYTYVIEDSGKVHYNLRSHTFDVIGSGAGLRKVLHKKIIELQGFGLNTPQLHWARPILMGEILAFLVEENKQVSASVGGPFQVARITPNGLETDYILPSGVDNRNVVLTDVGSKLIVSNPLSDKTYELLTIWDLPHSIIS